MAELRPEGLEHGGRKRRRAGHEEPHPPPMRRAASSRQLEEAHVHGRHSEEERGPELLEERLGLVVLEALHEPHPAAAREPRADAVAEPVHVEERQHGEVAVLGRDAPRLDERARVGGEVPVGEHGSLGPAGGARRVDDRGGRTGRVDRRGIRRTGPEGPRDRQSLAGLSGELLHVPGRRSGGNESREIRRRHHRHGLGVADDVAHLALAVEDVDRDEDRRRASDRPGTGRGTRGRSGAARRGGPRHEARAPRGHAPSAAPRLDLAERQRLGSARPPGRDPGRPRPPRPTSDASKRSSSGLRLTRQG